MDRKGSRKKAPVPAAPPPPAPAPPPPAEPSAPVLTRRVVPARPAPVPPRPAARPAARSFFSSSPTFPFTQGGEKEVEHRRFPRAPLATRFELWIEEQGARRFSATLASVNVSVAGAFLESTFFLPVSTELRVRFGLGPGMPPVEARARVVREQRSAEDGLPSGFGIDFEEFYGQTEVALARLFLDTRLRAFAEEYLASPRARGLPEGLERVVDALAAWELRKAHASEDAWRGE